MPEPAAMLLRLIDRLETFGMAFFFSAALIAGVAQVVARYVFNAGVVWSEQAFVKFTVWACLIGAARAVRDGLHVRVDLFLDRLPPPARRAAELANLAINLAFCGTMLWAALGYLDFLIAVGTTNVESGVPEWVAYLVTPLFLALMCVRYAALLPATLAPPGGNPWQPDGPPPPAPAAR
ncbi:TRAP transporter small permease [Caldovatus aquaticus]|uniref:TRAP transporter small permease protein n=1 Tax=Caldovatus aquaticus TaxID=2865671 RepID=A0ABS7F1N4_9PROT|nr:TRAP transporter small permease [Caldovatus aquaticus]MBW8268690.1 TRAP transporter small permease [Caldovatus aquaticus]